MFNERRYVDSGALFDNPLKADEPGHDKIFILARVQNVSTSLRRQFNVDIDDGMPTYAQNDNVRISYGLRIPILSDVNRTEWGEKNGLALLSAGCFVWILPNDGDPRMVVLKKDAGAGRWAHYYTNPSGRCDRSPRISMLEECAQEICAVLGRQPLLPPTSDPEIREELLRYKTEQVRAKRNYLKDLGCDVDALQKPRWMRNMALPGDYSKLGDVIIRRNGAIISRLNSVVVDWYANDNCLDMNKVVGFHTRKDLQESFRAVDGENFGRSVELLTVRELREGRLLMPQLKNYLENHAA
jgi:hypothetical protein